MPTPLTDPPAEEPASRAQLHLLSAYGITAPPQTSKRGAELLLQNWNEGNPESESRYAEWKRSLQRSGTPYQRTQETSAYREIVRAMPRRVKSVHCPPGSSQPHLSVWVKLLSVILGAAAILAISLLRSCAG